MGKTLRGKAALDAWDKMAVWITPARRTRIASAVTAALAGNAANPKALTWPDKYIGLLGHRANRADRRAVTLLEQKEEGPARATLHSRLVATHRPPRYQGAGGGYRAHSAPRGLMDAAPCMSHDSVRMVRYANVPLWTDV
jgi:hypothetical protein